MTTTPMRVGPECLSEKLGRHHPSGCCTRILIREHEWPPPLNAAPEYRSENRNGNHPYVCCTSTHIREHEWPPSLWASHQNTYPRIGMATNLMGAAPEYRSENRNGHHPCARCTRMQIREQEWPPSL
eukprot:9251710-Pyramimonas_sp.AAC.1